MEKLTNVKLSNFDSPFHLPILKLQNSHLKDESPWICSSKIQFTLQKRGFDLHNGESPFESKCKWRMNNSSRSLQCFYFWNVSAIVSSQTVHNRSWRSSTVLSTKPLEWVDERRERFWTVWDETVTKRWQKCIKNERNNVSN